MGVLIGIVGKPSSGKSSFFSACTLIDVAIANYPFTTIEPNKGTGFIRTDCADKHFNVQCNPRTGYCINNVRFVPVELIDVAGLVPGASEGKGLGNKFLDDLRRADALIHVIDLSGSTNEKGEQVTIGSHDPCEDIVFLEKEIDAWFFGILKNNWQKISKQHYDSKEKRLEALGQIVSGLNITLIHTEIALRKMNATEKQFKDFSETDLLELATQLRIESKPILIAANKCDLPNSEQTLKKIRERFPGKKIIPCSAIAELTLKKAAKNQFISYNAGDKEFKAMKELDEKQKKGMNYIQENVLNKFGSTGVQDCLEKTIFEELNYIAIFPGGTKKLTDSEGRILPDCFLLPKNSTAIDFAFKLHSDIGNNFIKAIDVKTKQLIGKEHPLKNGDVIEIIFNK